jgi:hypothetical protein
MMNAISLPLGCRSFKRSLRRYRAARGIACTGIREGGSISYVVTPDSIVTSVVNDSEYVDRLAFNVVADAIGKAARMNPTYTLAAVADTGYQRSFGKPLDRFVYFGCKVRAQTLTLVFIPPSRLYDVRKCGWQDVNDVPHFLR